MITILKLNKIKINFFYTYKIVIKKYKNITYNNVMQQKLIIGTFATIYTYAFYRNYIELSKDNKYIAIKYFGL